MLMGCRGCSFSGRRISGAGEALGMFCTNRMGSRGAEEQEVLVQDVELDLTGTANTNRVRARRDPVGSGINEIPALPWCCFSVAAVRKQCWGGRKKEGSWELGVRMYGQLSLLLKSVLRSISSKVENSPG